MLARSASSSPPTKNNRGGRIEMVVGPMFAGKSQELLTRATRVRLADDPYILVKHASDTRYTHDPVVITHTQQRSLDDCQMVTQLADVVVPPETRAIFIDECHFFADLVPMCEQWKRAGMYVVAVGLDKDYRRKPWANVCELMGCCDHVAKMQAVCKFCKSYEATETVRLSSDIEQVLVGGQDVYLPACYWCHLTYDHSDPAPSATE